MRILSFAIILALLASDIAYARSVRFYNRNGMYAGRISSMGNVYNRNGVYAGRIR